MKDFLLQLVLTSSIVLLSYIGINMYNSSKLDVCYVSDTEQITIEKGKYIQVLICIENSKIKELMKEQKTNG